MIATRDGLAIAAAVVVVDECRIAHGQPFLGNSITFALTRGVVGVGGNDDASIRSAAAATITPPPPATAGDLVVVVINDGIFPKVTSIYTLRERKQDGCPTSFTTLATAKASRNQRPMPLTFQVIPASPMWNDALMGGRTLPFSGHEFWTRKPTIKTPHSTRQPW